MRGRCNLLSQMVDEPSPCGRSRNQARHMLTDVQLLRHGFHTSLAPSGVADAASPWEVTGFEYCANRSVSCCRHSEGALTS
jgi:hypothetical protein